MKHIIYSETIQEKPMLNHFFTLYLLESIDSKLASYFVMTTNINWLIKYRQYIVYDGMYLLSWEKLNDISIHIKKTTILI